MLRTLLMCFILSGLSISKGLADEKSASAKPESFTGKVVPIAEALKKQGLKADADSDGLVLLAATGEMLTIMKDDASRKLFLDEELRNREVRLTGIVVTGSKILKVQNVQTVVDGKLLDVDYWCFNCQLGASQPGKCLCCGSDVIRRELPTKPAK